MPDLTSFAILTFSALFFVVDPFAVIPMFLVITQGDTTRKKRWMALKASGVATVTLLVFAATGGAIFRLFGVTLGAFRIAGGILLFLMAIEMVRAQRSRVRTSPEEVKEGVEKEDVAIIPLGIPMLAGPGAIATVMVVMGEAKGDADRMLAVVGCILLTGLVTFLLLRVAPLLEKVLKTTGINILNRIMGLLLAAMAVQFMVNGFRDVLPQILGK